MANHLSPSRNDGYSWDLDLEKAKADAAVSHSIQSMFKSDSGCRATVALILRASRFSASQLFTVPTGARGILDDDPAPDATGKWCCREADAAAQSSNVPVRGAGLDLCHACATSGVFDVC